MRSTFTSTPRGSGSSSAPVRTVPEHAVHRDGPQPASVVQAAENANLAVLKRVGDHVEIINDVDEIRGWRVDQILTSDLFGLKSARPPEVEALFARKEALLAKARMTAAEKTELAEIQKKIDNLPVGDVVNSEHGFDALRKAIDLLKSQTPK